MNWNNMKKSTKGLKYAMNESMINEYLNNYTFTTLYKKPYLRKMTLKALRYYYGKKYETYLKECNYEEISCPSIVLIDDRIKKLQSDQKQKYIEDMKKTKIVSRGNRRQWSLNDDLYDCYKPLDTSEICSDVLKRLNIEMSKGKRIFSYVKKLFIPISHIIEFREFWEDADKDEKKELRKSDEYPRNLELSCEGL
ncbi:UNKNOWN [Stylonychia lemnae]|uniref:Uncharacterized protein n=1 Tax=Stylonychia lemnae TaxID=5949 RepID=A0A078AIT6_STYLE|nr:UNKNOWN [Stylonychia lemnae]|eukprot:CDW82210.1 UNKNOWN [Stylonychia lemnae]